MTTLTESLRTNRPKQPPSRLDRNQQNLLINDLPGGYWQYDVVDHVLLVNLYFPPHELYREISERMPSLVSCYPSPHAQLVENIGLLIGQDPGRIVIGNGTTELISILIRRFGLSAAVPTPSFNPYEDAAAPVRLVRFELRPPSFELDIEAYGDFVIKADVDAAVVISPNNPTSRAVRRTELLALASRLAAYNKILILDESFVEFVPDEAFGSLERDVADHPNLIILKSLGKVYGICGLRLGYLLTSNQDLVRTVRDALPPWNTNTIAEYVIKQLKNLEGDAKRSWGKVQSDRDHLFSALRTIVGTGVLRPHANFVFCRIPPDWPDGSVLADRMLRNHGILIRHSGRKTLAEGTRYLRIATRTKGENQRLVECLEEVARQ